MADMSIDASRVQRPPPPPPPPPPAPAPDAVAQTRDVVAGASGVNELRGGAAQDLLGARPSLAHAPVDPAVDASADLDAAYRDAGAEPPMRASDVRAPDATTPAEEDGNPRTAGDAVLNAQDQQAAVSALGQRAGVDTSGGTGRMNPAWITRRADAVSWNLQNGQPRTMADGRPIAMSDTERAALDGGDADARRRTADAIGRRVATQESFERAVGGPDNARRIEESYQGATSDQRFLDAPQIDREANAQRLAQVAEVASLFAGGAGILRAAGGALLRRLGIGAAARTAATRGAYEIAKEGGLHAGFLARHAQMTTQQLQRSVRSLERQIAEHQSKIADPGRHLQEWARLDPRQQVALVQQKWPADIARQQQQLDIVRGLLRERGL